MPSGFQAVVDTGILANVLPSTLANPNASIVRESCWLVSNVLAGTHLQIQSVIDAGLLQPVIASLLHAESSVRIEASWAVFNLMGR